MTTENMVEIKDLQTLLAVAIDVLDTYFDCGDTDEMSAMQCRLCDHKTSGSTQRELFTHLSSFHPTEAIHVADVITSTIWNLCENL